MKAASLRSAIPARAGPRGNVPVAKIEILVAPVVVAVRRIADLRARVPGSGGPTSALIVEIGRSELFRDYQGAFEAAFGLPLALRAPGSFQPPMNGSKRINRFCALLARTSETCASCLQVQQRLEAEATLLATTLECHAGLVESAVPVHVGAVLVGYLQTGQTFLRAPTRKRFATFLATLGMRHDEATRRALEEAYFETGLLSKERYAAVIRLMAIFALQLSALSNQLHLRAKTQELPVVARARAYMLLHHEDNMQLGDVARAMNTSSFYFCKIFRRETGFTFTQYLARLRIEAVKEMLLVAHTRVSEAGFAAGFQSLSQFNRVFRHVVGEAPSAYRERLHPHAAVARQEPVRLSHPGGPGTKALRASATRGPQPGTKATLVP